MTKRKYIKTGIFLFLIFFIFSHPAKSYELNENEKSTIQDFKKILLDYEKIFIQKSRVDSTDFKNYSDSYAELIELYISLGEKYSDGQFTDLAFSHLEKFKSQKMLYLFLHATISDSTINKLKNILSQTYSSEKCLKENEAILDLWIYNDIIHIFTVTVDTVVLTRLHVSAAKIKEQILELTSTLFLNHDLLNLKFDYHLSFQLYNQLFHPVEKHLEHVNTINIIPDNFLLNFPFEILVTDTTITNNFSKDILYQDLKELKYLIHKYAIFYNNSTQPLCPELFEDGSSKNIGRRLLTMSDPLMEIKSNVSGSKIDVVSKYDLKNSDFSADEVRRVSRLLWRHDNITGEEVIKDYIFNKGRNYRWIYLAQPGILNNTNPLSSGLLFSNTNKSDNSALNWLSCSDVMQSYLRADMITLSFVKLIPPFSEQNDGIIALPQSLILSGIKSVVFSLWEINCISNSQFMSKFYWELKYKRQTNVKALREAKLASMKDTIKFLDQKISRAHPFFWAGFRLIGYPRVTSPSNAPIPPWGIVLIIYIIVIVIGLTIARKTLPTK
ncbi:CHAT domain-containing protein [candidate division KSB1 bacterium]|nr:CHAT domain-containing protein [candidate division KSB1 bacterium]